MPVMLPPGRLRLATVPIRRGRDPPKKQSELSWSRLSSQRSWRTTSHNDNGHVTANQICGQRRQPIVVFLCPSVFDGDVVAFGKSCIG